MLRLVVRSTGLHYKSIGGVQAKCNAGGHTLRSILAVKSTSS